MARQSRSGKPDPRDSRSAPEPEGPEEVYRRFERLNRRGSAGSLRDRVGGSGKKALYVGLAVVEVSAIVLGFFFNIPFMDIVALGLPGLLVMFHGGSKNEEPDKPNESNNSEESNESNEPESGPGEGSLLDRLLELLEDGEDSGSPEKRRAGSG